jgi:hypothetical protein
LLAHSFVGVVLMGGVQAKQRRAQLPLHARFLLTSDVYPAPDADPSTFPSAVPETKRSQQPPPLFFLPAKLLPAQEALLARRKAETQEKAEQEWAVWEKEREDALKEIEAMKDKAGKEEEKLKEEKEEEKKERQERVKEDVPKPDKDEEMKPEESTKEGGMDVDESPPVAQKAEETKEEDSAMQMGEDDAVEY